MTFLTRERCLFDFSAYQKLSSATSKCVGLFFFFFESLMHLQLFVSLFIQQHERHKIVLEDSLSYLIAKKSVVGNHNRNAKSALPGTDEMVSSTLLSLPLITISQTELQHWGTQSFYSDSSLNIYLRVVF